MMRLLFRRSYVLVMSTFLFVSCDNSYTTIVEHTAIPDQNNHHQDTILSDTLRKCRYSRITKKESQGLQVSYEVPAKFQGKEIYLVFEGNVRSNYAYSNSYIVIAVFDNKMNQLMWRSFPLRYHYFGVNEWSPFKDSLYLEGSFDNRTYKMIKALAYLGKSEFEKFDIDTLQIQIKAKL